MDGGTEITGSFTMDKIKVNAYENLLAISLVCEITPEILAKVFSLLDGKPIYGVSTGRSSLTVFTSPEKMRETIRELHSLENVKAISCRKGIAMIEVLHPSFISSPGWVARISGALSSRGINIIEVTTSKASINIFIDEDKLKYAVKALGDVVEA